MVSFNHIYACYMSQFCQKNIKTVQKMKMPKRGRWLKNEDNLKKKGISIYEDESKNKLNGKNIDPRMTVTSKLWIRTKMTTTSKWKWPHAKLNAKKCILIDFEIKLLVHQGEFSLVASIKVKFLASVTKNVVLSFWLITLKI